MVNEFTIYTVHYTIPSGNINAQYFELDVIGNDGLSDEDILKEARNLGLDQNAVVVGISPWIE